MKRNPFLTGERFNGIAQEWVDAQSRLDRVKDFSAEECRAALGLHDLQKSVRVAIERRLRRLSKGGGMKRVSVLILLLAVMAMPAEAFPWKKAAKIAFVWGAPMATSLLATKGGMDCRRRNGVEPCTEHYGEFRDFEIARGIFSFSMSATTWACLKEDGWRGCYPIAGGAVAWNTITFVQQERIHLKTKDID